LLPRSRDLYDRNSPWSFPEEFIVTSFRLRRPDETSNYGGVLKHRIRDFISLTSLLLTTTVLAGTASAAPAKQVVFQLSEPAARSFQLSRGWSSANATNSAPSLRTGVQALDLRLSSLDPSALAPAFDLSKNSAAKRAAGLDRIYVLEYRADLSPDDASLQLAGIDVDFCEPNYVVEATGNLPNDPDISWGHVNPVFPFGWTADADSDADIAWDYETGDPNLIIAIVDTGVDPTHPEFAGRFVPGFDFVNNDADPSDDEGHGTACAGIAAAAGNNGIGIAGVVWDSKVMPVKVLDDEGSGLSSWVADGIEFAADNGAKIISLSLGSESSSSLINAAVNYAYNTHGALLFAATGNDNQSTIEYPARFPNVMAVGSMSPCLERKHPGSCDGEGWWGSDYGTGIDFLAPGVLVHTTDITGAGGYSLGDYYTNFNGTSSATPYAAGAAALVWSMYPTLTNAEVRDLLRLSAEDMGDPGYDTETGYGHINPASAIEAARFTDATTSLLGNTGTGRGVSFGDFDNDGDADLYLTNAGSANVLLENDGGDFLDAGIALVEDSGQSFGSAFGDANGDGDLDLYLANDGANRLFENLGQDFAESTVAPLDNPDPGTTTGWIDYDNDNDLDLYLSNDGQNKILQNDGDGVFTDVSALPLGNSRSGNGFAWGDYDSDGDMDVYLANDGANRLLRNDGSGVFASDTGGLLDNLTTRGAMWGDVDNDGDMDLFVTNDGDPNRLWINDAGSFTDIATGALANTGTSYGVAMADYNNDGWIDILVANENGANQLFRNENGTSFSTVANHGFLADGGEGRGVAWADANGDGALDFYVVNSDGANLFVANEQPGDRNWAQYRLRGVESNRPAIGTRIRIVAGGMSQIREITAGSGYCSQDEMVAAFGIGTATTIDSLIVDWPSGATDVATDLPINVRSEFAEGEGLPVSVPGPELAQIEPGLGRNQPNPVYDFTTIPFSAPSRMQARLEVYAIDGRRIRTLLDAPVEAGQHEIAWDRRDNSGVPVASGIYFYRLDTDTRSESRSMVVR